MRWIGLLALLLVVSCGRVTAVSDSDGPPADAISVDSGGGFPDAQVVAAGCSSSASCGDSRTIVTKADLVAVAGLCAVWGNPQRDRYRNRTATFTVPAGTPGFSVCPSDFGLPSDCVSGSPLCEARIIELDPFLSGVGSVHKCDQFPGAQFSAGTRFRIRYDIVPPSLGARFRTARIRFERACDAECQPTERRCDENRACYSGDQVCFECDRRSLEECACYTPDDQPVGECAACEVFSGDTIALGRCSNNTCNTVNPCEVCPCDM